MKIFEKNEHIVVLLTKDISLIYNKTLCAHKRVFHDTRFFQIIWQIFREEQNKFHQKLLPVGIEPRTSGSSL